MKTGFYVIAKKEIFTYEWHRQTPRAAIILSVKLKKAGYKYVRLYQVKELK